MKLTWSTKKAVRLAVKTVVVAFFDLLPFLEEFNGIKRKSTLNRICAMSQWHMHAYGECVHTTHTHTHTYLIHFNYGCFSELIFSVIHRTGNIFGSNNFFGRRNCFEFCVEFKRKLIIGIRSIFIQYNIQITALHHRFGPASFSNKRLAGWRADTFYWHCSGKLTRFETNSLEPVMCCLCSLVFDFTHFLLYPSFMHLNLDIRSRKISFMCVAAQWERVLHAWHGKPFA